MQNVSDHVAIQLLDLLPTPPSEDIKTRAKAILPGLTNLLIWARLRNWWWQWILGIFVAIGGLMGTILLMNQNELLEAQNIKIDSQTNLMQKQTELAQQQMSLSEASRRSALVVLMSNIMDKVDREIESQQKRLSFKQKEKREYKLSKSLIGQIAALSHSFKPYRYMEGDSLIKQPLSPERGQLLITITLLPLDTFTLKKIYQTTTLQNADLQNAFLAGTYLSGAYLIGADLSGAHLIKANLSGAYLIETNLSEAYLIGAYLSGADLSGADLSGADLSGANLSGANLSGANLSGAHLIETNLSGADLSGADLSRAYLSGADLSRAYLGGADLSEAYLIEMNLSGADLSITQLSKSKNLYNCENLHDTLKLPLQQSHPQLFQDPLQEEEE